MVIFTAIGMLSISRFGFLFHNPLPQGVNLVLCAVAGAVGGILLFRAYRYAGLIGGAIAGITGFVGLSWYVPFRASTTLHSLEIIFVQIVASLPGVVAGFIVYWAYYKPIHAPRETDVG